MFPFGISVESPGREMKKEAQVSQQYKVVAVTVHHIPSDEMTGAGSVSLRRMRFRTGVDCSSALLSGALLLLFVALADREKKKTSIFR